MRRETSPPRVTRKPALLESSTRDRELPGRVHMVPTPLSGQHWEASAL